MTNEVKYGIINTTNEGGDQHRRLMKAERKDYIMTKREFLNAVIAGNITENEIAFAQKEIETLDARNAKRASTPSKTQLANEPLKQKILAELKAVGEFRTASEVCSWFGLDEDGNPAMSVQKASSLLRQLETDGCVEKTEVKVPKKGKMKGYRAISE